MFSHLSVFLITSTNVLASSFITTTTPSATPLARRQNAAHVPTFTFRPNSEYFPTSAGNPEPSGTSLQVYPTGSWERFPDEGITVALGPELRGQIKDAVEKSCGDASTQQCRDALTPLLQSSEVTQHVKRFVPFLPFVVGIGIALVLNLLLGTAGVSRNGPPQEIKLNNVDLAQIQTLGGASTIAVVSDGAAPSTVSFAPAVTTTTPETITIETSTSDSQDHKAGDILYRLPHDTAQRINDFLMMTGLQDTREACKPLFSPRSLTFPLSSRSLFRRAPDPAKQDCIRRQQRHAIDLADPAGGLLQLAQAAIPPRPGPGQAVGVPIEDILLEGVAIIVPVYRVEVFNARAQVQEGVDAGMLARAAVAVSIVARLVYATGFLEEIWVSKDSLVKNYGEDKFVCLKDLICVDEECGGQEDGKTLKTGFTPICKKLDTYGCQCEPVLYPRMHELPKEYMDDQYSLLEELIKRANAPQVEAKCTGDEQSLNGAADQMRDMLGKACEKYPSLGSSWSFQDTGKGNKGGFSWTIQWSKKGDCSWDCHTLFDTFLTSSCLKESGLSKNGEMQTECGSALYVGYELNSGPPG